MLGPGADTHHEPVQLSGIPQLFSLLGLVPGLLILLAVAIMTSYASWIIGRFKVRHPEVSVAIVSEHSARH